MPAWMMARLSSIVNVLLPPVPHLRAALAAPNGSADRVPPPAWDPQAALVWTAAVAATGWRGQVAFPVAPSGSLSIALKGGRPPSATRTATGKGVRIDGPGASVLLPSLLAVAATH